MSVDRLIQRVAEGEYTVRYINHQFRDCSDRGQLMNKYLKGGSCDDVKVQFGRWRSKINAERVARGWRGAVGNIVEIWRPDGSTCRETT